MANRHLSRSIALQSLFEWDFNGCQEKTLPAIVERNVAEFAPGLENLDFVRSLTDKIVAHQEKLDLIIEKAAPDWPLAQIAIIDRNTLRLGLQELLFADHKEVPARVAINEAIELAKTFGGENSGKFVNGVLGAVYKEMGEPGKDEIPARKKHPPDIPYEQMPVEKLCGAVVYTKQKGQVELVLVHDIFGYWTLTKGHLNSEEEKDVGCSRGIQEELSLTAEIKTELGTNEYIASDPEKGKIRKQVTYYLAETANPETLKLSAKSGLDDARWFALAALPELRLYDDIVPFITKALKIINHAR